MHGRVRAGAVAIAISLCTITLPAVAVAARIAQNAPSLPSPAGGGGKGGAAADRSQPNNVGAPAALTSNSPEQVRKAQIELRRLDCLKGRIDGKLGERTRQAVRKFWVSAKQPAPDEVNITDELILALTERGDNFCRPPRPFFGFGGRALPPFAPGARPGSFPPAVTRPPSPDAAH